MIESSKIVVKALIAALWTRAAVWRARFCWAASTTVLLTFVVTSLAAAQEKPTAVTPEPTPTMDRLAAPPTVASPTQADEGAQLYWLHCQPCHGDQGQGLTDEWRAQFPPEEQNCWQSGCHGEHGKDKPENGFVLPTAVPPLTTDDSLDKFGSMAEVYHYMRVRMPYEAPGRLTDDEYLAVTAHLARAHDLWDGVPLNPTSLAELRLKPLPAGEEKDQRPDVSRSSGNVNDSPQSQSTMMLFRATVLPWGGAVIVLLSVGGAWLWRRRQ